MQNRWVKYAVIAGAWAFVGLVLSVEVYFNERVRMPDVDFGGLAMPQFVRAMMWAALAPLILQLHQKIPLSRGRWAGGVGFHFAFSFVVMATFYLGRILGYTIFWDEPFGNFWVISAKSFFGRNIIDMAYYWAVLAFGHGLDIYQKFKSEELKAAQLEARLIETELKALRQQMNPHFLFNTMNTVAVLVREGKNDEAVTLLARLSSLLRMSIDNTGVPEITLRQEVDFLERYLDIQRARFSDRLQVSIDIAPGAMEARIPNLLLQPLVENAILHGIAPKPGPGRVEVLGRVEAGHLHLEVRDDGPGFDPGAHAKEGVGLTNTRERIAKIYGAHGRLSLRTEPGRGVSVQITLPCRL